MNSRLPASLSFLTEYVDTRAKVAQYSDALGKIVKLLPVLSVSFRKLTRGKTSTACDGCFCKILLLPFLFLCGSYITRGYNQDNSFGSVHGRTSLEKEWKCIEKRVNLGQYFSLRKLASSRDCLSSKEYYLNEFQWALAHACLTAYEWKVKRQHFYHFLQVGLKADG